MKLYSPWNITLARPWKIHTHLYIISIFIVSPPQIYPTTNPDSNRIPQKVSTAAKAGAPAAYTTTQL
jgi:hypothetical protein